MPENIAPPGSTPPRREGLAAPPYQVYFPHNFSMGVRFDPAAVRAVLPSGLTPVTRATGGVGLNLSGPEDAGRVVAAWVYVDVEGFDTPDDRPGRFHVVEFFATPYFAFSRANFCRYAESGGGEVSRAGNLLHATAGPSGRPVITMKARIRPDAMTSDISFTMHNLSVIESGQITFAPKPTFMRQRLVADPVDLAISSPPGHPLHPLVPRELIWASYNSDVSATTGLARPLSGSVPPALEGLLFLLSQLGRGAVLVEENGRVLFANDAARDMLGSWLTSAPENALRGGDAEGRAALDRILDLALDATQGLAAANAVALSRSAGRKPLLVMALPAISVGHADATGRVPRAAVLLLTDPDLPPAGPRFASRALQLLGLTPFEARVAATTATGLARREVARRLDLSEATVRVTMSVVYDKLGLTRQSELARAVARLEPLG